MRRPVPKRIARPKNGLSISKCTFHSGRSPAPRRVAHPIFRNGSTYPKERPGAQSWQEPLRGAVIGGIAAANGMPMQAVRWRHRGVDHAVRPQKVVTAATTSLPSQWHRGRRNDLRCRCNGIAAAATASQSLQRHRIRCNGVVAASLQDSRGNDPRDGASSQELEPQWQPIAG